jgi:hypothetical protein
MVATAATLALVSCEDGVFAIRLVVEFPAKRRAERVRQVLSSRGLTLYRVSERSAEIFGRPSPYYVPHNLYYDIDQPSLIPTFQQMLALSHITGYQLGDWFAMFGFDLDVIHARHGCTKNTFAWCWPKPSAGDSDQTIPWLLNTVAAWISPRSSAWRMP